MGYKQRSLSAFIALFFILAFIIFAMIRYDKNSRVDAILEEQYQHLKISYDQGIDRFKIIAQNVYVSIQDDPQILEYFAQASNQKLQKSMHDKLHAYYESEFRRLQLLDVLQVHFVLPDNTSFLRMHKPEKYGDDLSDIRKDIAYVNKTHDGISGFAQGKTIHAFRHVYPLYKDGEYIGAVDVSFSSTILQDYTMRVSDIHTHFIVNKKVFASNEWKSASAETYYQSVEHKDFFFSMSDHVDHDRLDKTQQKVMTPLRSQIDAKIATGERFVLFERFDNENKIVAFLPIKDLFNKETVAYIVSYTSSEKLERTCQNYYLVLGVSITLLAVLLFVIYNSIKHNATLKEELKYDALTKVFNRKYFLQIAQREASQTQELGGSCSLVMVDIDHFKNINDTYGHQCGDVILQEFAALLEGSIRRLDVVGRYGGEEFIMLINASEDDAYRVVEKIRQKIEANSFCTEKALAVTASFGIAKYNTNTNIELSIHKADTALYDAKNSGRNRVCVSE